MSVLTPSIKIYRLIRIIYIIVITDEMYILFICKIQGAEVQITYNLVLIKQQMFFL